MKMLRLSLLLVMLFSTCLINEVCAQQPYGGCWYLDDVRDWKPENDPDAKFNKSTIPLQERIADDVLKANPYQHNQGRVAASLTMNPEASLAPSQGANNFTGYNPTYWQYMDLVVWWGGSAGEGIVLLPTAPVIDICHLNGVKVLGQVFFPEGPSGGNPAWIEQILTKENGKYPYAEKLFDIAQYYGFDGWFINEEIYRGGFIPGIKTRWTELVQAYIDHAHSKGVTNHEIQWYDTDIDFQNYKEMITKPGVSYFFDYNSAVLWNIKLQMDNYQAEGFTKKEALETLYFGVEFAKEGKEGGRAQFLSLFPEDEHRGSIQMFNPEEPLWKKVVADILKTSDNNGQKAYDAMKTVFDNENTFWVNSDLDPSITRARLGGIWPGYGTSKVEQSTIQSKPFYSSFSAGLGKHRFVNGEKKGTQDWYHRGMQDIMPTWRWWVERSDGKLNNAANNRLRFDLNWDDAYNYGTSILVNGKLEKDIEYLARLYKTNIAITNGDVVELVYKTSAANTIEIQLGTKEDNNAMTKFPITTTSTNYGWTVAKVDISQLAGKTLSVVALSFKSNKVLLAYKAELGQIAIYNSSYNPTVSSVTNLSSQNELHEKGGNIRLVWDASNIEDIHHFNVYMERDGIGKQLVGQTRNEAFFISNFERISTPALEGDVKVYVVPVSQNMVEGQETSLVVPYPQLDKPEVVLKASKTLIKQGDEVEIEVRATGYPTTYEWETPGNAELISTNGNKATFKFTSEGLYSFKVKVTNAVGATSHEEKDLVEVDDLKELNVVSVGKTIDSSSGYVEPEAPKNIIDGIQLPKDIQFKWCAGGKREHWTIIDLESEYHIYRFRTFDCGHLENYSDNFKAYKIYTSMDKVSWDLVVDEIDRPENTKDDYIKPVHARYVKFVPYDKDEPIIIRIWEFEVFGTPSISFPDQEDIVVYAGEELKVEFPYQLHGDKYGSDFTYNVTLTDNTLLTMKDISVDKTKETINFTLTPNGSEGETSLTATLTNNNVTKTVKVKVMVKDPFLKNVTKNADAIAISKPGTPSETTENIPEIIDGDENTVWMGFGANDKHVLIDLKESYDLTTFHISYRYGAPSPFEGLQTLDIYVSDSDDPSTFQLVSQEAVPLTTPPLEYTTTLNAKARYVKLVFNADGICNFIIKEVEMMSGPTEFTVDGVDDMSIEKGSRKLVKAKYFVGADMESDYNIKVVSSQPSLVKIENVNNDKDQKYLTFDVAALETCSDVPVTITQTNNGQDDLVTFNVTVTSNNKGNYTLKVPSAQSVKIGSTTPLEATYDLGDDIVEGNFDITVVSASTDVEIKNINIDRNAKKVTFDAKAGNNINTGINVAVKLTNGIFDIEKTFVLAIAQGNVGNYTIVGPTDDKIRVGTTKDFEANYSLGRDTEESNFEIKAISSNVNNVKIVSVNINKTMNQIVIKAEAGSTIGADADVTITLTNDTFTKTEVFNVKLVSGNTNAITFVQPNDVSQAIETTRQKKVEFDWNGDLEESNFDVQVVSTDNTIAKVNNISVDKAQGIITLDIETGATVGSQATITVTLINGTQNVATDFIVAVTATPVNQGAITFMKPNDAYQDQLTTEEYRVQFDWNEDFEESNFFVDVKSSSQDVAKILNVTTDKANGIISFFVLAGNTSDAKSTISIELTNGTQVLNTSFVLTLNENLVGGNAKVYPNPVTRGESINVDTSIGKTVHIYSMNGMEVMVVAARGQITTVSTVNLVPGLYLVKVKGDGANSKPRRILVR